MSQIVQDVVLSPAKPGRETAAWRTPTFALSYSVAIVATVAALASYPNAHIVVLQAGLFSFLWRASLPVLAAFVAIGFYLLVLAPRRFLATLFLLAIAHGIVGAIAFWMLSRDSPSMANDLFFSHGTVFWLAVAALSAALAYWNRRRCWRIQRDRSKELTSPKRTPPPITTLDCIYLASVLVGMGLFQKWAQGPMAEALPVGVIVVGMMAGIARVALSPGGRGFSPVAVMVTGLTCLMSALLFVWYFYPQQSVILMVLFGIPLVLWSGVGLSLRGDGYRLVRDFSALPETDPIAEPDPLA